MWQCQTYSAPPILGARDEQVLVQLSSHSLLVLDESSGAFWTNHGDYVLTMKNFFDILWDKATPFIFAPRT
jgi:hypothetical protein